MARGTARRSPAPEAPATPDKRVRTREATEARPTPTLGFRESQRQKKDAKEKARREQAAKRPESRKKK